MVRLAKPRQVTVGVRPLRDGEEPILKVVAGRTMTLVPEEGSEDVPPIIIDAGPIQSVPSSGPQVPVVSDLTFVFLCAALKVLEIPLCRLRSRHLSCARESRVPAKEV